MKDRVGDDIASNAISGEADDRIDDVQEGLSSGNSCEELQKDDVLVLCEDDIPGSSLNGRDPDLFNIQQLKRWLACRGAPVSGKKSELVER